MRGFFSGAALLLGLTCLLFAASGDLVVWTTPLLVEARTWGVLCGIAWLLVASQSVRRLARGPRMFAVVMLGLIGLAAVLDTVSYYSLLSGGAIRTSRACPASLAVVLLVLFSLRELGRNGVRVRLWKLELCGSVAGGVAACVVALLTFGATDYRRPADCAIVLGAAVRANGSPSLALSDRVAEGIRLYHEGHVALLVMSGGVDPVHGLSEAQVMKQLAIDAGVPAAAVLLDEAGVSTRASAVNCAQLMQQRDLEDALLVSHGYHLLRAKSAFARAGVVVFTVPATETRTMRKTPYFVLRECVAWVYYAMPNRG